MSKPILVAVILALSSTVALAEPNEDSLSGKAMRDNPGHTGGGTTANPTKKPEEQSLSGKAMRDQPGNTGGGTTSMPTAKPDEESLSGKVMRDLPGNR